MLINGICFQLFERIERIEPLEHSLDSKTQSFFYKTKMPITGICFQPFERIERIEPLELCLARLGATNSYNLYKFLLQPSLFVMEETHLAT